MTERCDRCKQSVSSGVVVHLSCQREADVETATLRAENERMFNRLVELEAALAGDIPGIARVRREIKEA